MERLDKYLAEANAGERRELQIVRDTMGKRRKRARRKLERAVRELPELRT
jgi:hypothetical protein